MEVFCIVGGFFTSWATREASVYQQLNFGLIDFRKLLQGYKGVHIDLYKHIQNIVYCKILGTTKWVSLNLGWSDISFWVKSLYFSGRTILRQRRKESNHMVHNFATSFPGDLPNSGIEPGSPAFQADALTSEPPGKPLVHNFDLLKCLTVTTFITWLKYNCQVSIL